MPVSVMLLSVALLAGVLGDDPCCNLIELSSSGVSGDLQPQRLGLYRAQDVGWSDRRIYKHIYRQEYLFYLQSRSKGLWMVGPKVRILCKKSQMLSKSKKKF